MVVRAAPVTRSAGTPTAVAFTTQLWVPNRSFKLNLDNNLCPAANSEAKPTNTFTATIKYFPSFNSGLFTSLQFESIHNSVADPETSSTVSGQLGWNSETMIHPLDTDALRTLFTKPYGEPGHG